MEEEYRIPFISSGRIRSSPLTPPIAQLWLQRKRHEIIYKLSLARYGGEEFAYIVPAIDHEIAITLTEEIRIHGDNLTLALKGPPLSITSR